MKRFFLTLSAALMLASASAAHDYTIGGLKIAHPMIPQPLTRAMTAAGYLSIENTGMEADRLIGVTSDIAARSEIHTTDHGSDGSAKMRHVEAIELAPNQTVTFEHGGYHVMFMGLKEGLAEGTMHKAKLIFENAGELEIEFKVEPARKSGSHDHGHKHN